MMTHQRCAKPRGNSQEPQLKPGVHGQHEAACSSMADQLQARGLQQHSQKALIGHQGDLFATLPNIRLTYARDQRCACRMCNTLTKFCWFCLSRCYCPSAADFTTAMLFVVALQWLHSQQHDSLTRHSNLQAPGSC